MQNHAVDRLTYENLIDTENIASLTHGYLLNCRCEGKSPKTMSNYAGVLKNFLWYCRENSFPSVSKLTAVHLRHLFWYLGSEKNRWGTNNPSSRKPASLTTVHTYHKVLRSFFNWLEREQLIHDNPFSHLETPKMEKKFVQALNVVEIRRLFNTCSVRAALAIRNKAILSVFLDTGLRVSELAHLTLEDVDIDSGSILVRHGKGGKQRVVHIGSRAQKALWRYVSIYRKGTSSRLFMNRTGEPLDAVGIKILVKRMGDRAKVKVSPHKLRHTFAISYLRAGGDVFSLQYLLGHTTLQMTQRYLQSLNADDAVNAHRKFSPLDNLGVW